MKNAMKKLTSLLLVALLLVGMIPFAASAAEGTAPAVPTVLVHVNGTLVNTVEGTLGSNVDLAGCVEAGRIDLNSVTVTDASGKKEGSDWVSLMNNGTLALDEAAYYHVYIETEAKPELPKDEEPKVEEPKVEEPKVEEPKVEESAPAIYALSIDVDGVNKVLTSGTSITYEECLKAAGIDTTKVNVTEAVYQYTAADGRIPNYNFGPGDKIVLTADTRVYFFTEKKAASGSGSTNNGVVDEEWMKDIYLYIYTNNDIIQPSKRVLLNNYSIVNDHKLSKAEILSVVDDYYKATNANNGIIWKGAYVETTNITALDFVAGLDQTNNGSSYIDNLDMARSSANVIIKVRVTGVTNVGTNYTADSSNPKTGDSIYTAMTVMGISAAALASVMYFYNKKRMAL